ncbi:LysR family transcriptional regulator [Labrenzia sp. CE80]|uniref:LysR family transcriptional regulator n=1 Tax=Labrenzia sp. CE80 TaxID=1788986 RepID=UPI00129B071E|nr:LysR family transcriptional regulator [Labrenzia sp. CE80]
MLEWNDYLVILAIARNKSLYKTARALGVAVSTVMRRVDQIEERAGAPLFRKAERGHEPTHVGKLLISKAEEMEVLAQAAELSLKSEIRVGQNKVRISASEVIAPFFVARHLAKIREKCPNLDIALSVSDRSPSQTAEEFDISLWPSTPSNEDLFGRKLTRVKWALFGMTQSENTPGMLSARSGAVVNLFGRDGAEKIIPTCTDAVDVTTPSMSTNSLIAAASLAASGIGPAYLPCILGRNWPGLHQLTSSADHQIGELWAIYRKDAADSPQIRTSLNLLVEAAASDESMFLGN